MFLLLFFRTNSTSASKPIGVTSAISLAEPKPEVILKEKQLFYCHKGYTFVGAMGGNVLVNFSHRF